MGRITEIMLMQQPQQAILYIEVKPTPQEIPALLGQSFMKIGTYLNQLGITPSDCPHVAYMDFENMNEQNMNLKVCFKTEKPIAESGDVKSGLIPSQKIIQSIYMGSPADEGAFYEEMVNWAKDKGYKLQGDSYEYYLTGPETPEKNQIIRVEIPLL